MDDVASQVAIGQRSDLASGVWAPPVTPLDADLKIDIPRAVGHMRWLLEGGCHGLAIMGTTSEATSFSVDERIALLDAALEAGIPADRFMVGSGCAALSDSVRLTAHATAAGCAVLTLPPFYYKDICDEGLYASYAEIIERVASADLKLYFYHFPKLSCVPITHAVIERLLTAYPGVIKGLKDSSGSAEGCAAFIKAFPQMAVFPGTETLLFDMLDIGGAGTITAGANVNPSGLRAVYDAYQSGEKDRARTLQDQATAARAVIQSRPMIPSLKAVLARGHGDEAWLRLRPPLVALDAAAREAQAGELAAAGYSFGA